MSGPTQSLALPPGVSNPFVYRPSIFGTKGDGVTDDTAAMQKALTATALVDGTLDIGGVAPNSPNGPAATRPTYLITSSLNYGLIHLTATNTGATMLTPNNNLFDNSNTYLSSKSSGSTTIGLEIDHITFDVTGGHVFTNTNWNGFSIHDCRAAIRSSGKAFWYSSNSSANQIGGIVENNTIRVYGATRTCEAIYILSSIGGGCAFMDFRNNTFQNNDNDNAMYYMWFECTNTHNYTNGMRFAKNVYDNARGGCVKLLSVQGAQFDNDSIVDTYTGTIGNVGMYYIGASTGGSQWASQNIVFNNCNRDLQGPNGSTSWDIYCEATTLSCTIVGYEVRDIPPSTALFYPYFNFNTMVGSVVRVNCYNAVITNDATQVVDIENGNINFSGTLSGAVLPGSVTPQDAGYIAWTGDPAQMQGNTKPGTNGNFYWCAIYVRTATTINNIHYWIDVAGTTGTTNENFAGLYTTGGTLLSASSDQSTNWYGSAGAKTSALVTPQAVSAGVYYVGFIVNGTTLPSFGRFGGALTGGNAANWPGNIGSSGGGSRYGAYAGAYTALPAPFTPSLVGTLAPISLWAGVN